MTRSNGHFCGEPGRRCTSVRPASPLRALCLEQRWLIGRGGRVEVEVPGSRCHLTRRRLCLELDLEWDLDADAEAEAEGLRQRLRQRQRQVQRQARLCEGVRGQVSSRHPTIYVPFSTRTTASGWWWTMEKAAGEGRSRHGAVSPFEATGHQTVQMLQENEASSLRVQASAALALPDDV
jgi:hypothetical protein